VRTRKCTVTFQRPFSLNHHSGRLPPGRYDLEIDEEEIQATDRTAYRLAAIHFYVETAASTRAIAVNSADLEAALQRDLKPAVK